MCITLLMLRDFKFMMDDAIGDTVRCVYKSPNDFQPGELYRLNAGRLGKAQQFCSMSSY